MVERICGVPEGDVPEGRRDGHLDRQRGEGRDDPVRARLDAALDRRPDHPDRGHAPAPPRERRAAGRRRERPARPLEHPGRDRHGRQHRDPARLPEDAPRRDDEPDGVPRAGDAHDAQQAGLGLDELLAELPEVHGLAPEIALGREGDEGERLRVRVDAEGGRQLFVGLRVRRHVPRHVEARRRRGARPRGPHHVRHEPRRDRAELAQDDRGPREAEVARRRGERRDRDRAVLEGAEGLRDAGRVEDRDGGLPAPGRPVRREGRDVHELGALDAVEVEGSRPARSGEDGPGDPRPCRPRGRRSCTGRTEASCRSRS